MSMRFLDLESSYFVDLESSDFVDAESPRFFRGRFLFGHCFVSSSIMGGFS